MSAALRQDRIRCAVLPSLALAGLLLAPGCSGPPPLVNTITTPEALGREVLERLRVRDLPGLQALMITRDEFADHVWPQLPASRPDRGVPMSFVWDRLEQQSDLTLPQLASRHGGQRYTLLQVLFDGETTDYGTIQVQRKSVLVVRTSRGEIERLHVFGSMLTQNGRSKVFSYVVD